MKAADTKTALNGYLYLYLHDGLLTMMCDRANRIIQSIWHITQDIQILIKSY